MTPEQIILLITILVAVITIVIIWLLIPRMVKKGIDVSGILGGTAKTIETAETVLDGVQLLYPNNQTLNLVDKIIGYAKEATAAAEQMLKASQITAGERKKAAKTIVYDMLSLAEIEIDSKVDNIVDGCIEATVWALPSAEAEQIG